MRVDDDPVSYLRESLTATAFATHPYRQPVIGWAPDIENWTLEDLQAHYDQFYQPGNAVVVAVGDFDPEVLAERIEHFFGDIPAGPPPPAMIIREQPPRGPRRIEVTRPAQLPFVMLSYPAPNLRNPDYAALEMLSVILSAGKSSRLRESLVREQEVALYAGASYNPTSVDDRTFTFAAQAQPQKTAREVEASLIAEIEKIQQAPPTAEEMSRARRQIEASFVFSQDSVFSRAMLLGRYAMADEWSGVDDYLAAIKGRHARRGAKGGTAMAGPEKTNHRNPAPGNTGARLGGELMSARCVVLSALLLLGLGQPAQALETHRHRLPNGLRVVIAEQKTVPIVAINCLIDGGARIDPRSQPGLASFTADLLDEGTRDATGPEIAREIDSLGGSLYVGASQDWTLASASLLARDFRIGLKLIANSLRFPTFPTDEIERVRRETLGAIKASDEDPASVASRTFRAALFGDTPYGHPIIGIPESVSGFSRSDVVKFHQENLKPDKTICAIVGDISPADALAAVKEFLGDWSGVAAQHTARLPAPASARNIAVFQPTSQASIVIGQLGIARDNPDYFPLLIMNHILGGGGFTSRLVERVRTREGLVYSIFSRFSSTRLPGAFRIGLQTKGRKRRESHRIGS